MTGFDLQIRIDAEHGVATAEVVLADGSRDCFHVATIDGTFDGYMAFFLAAMNSVHTNWLESMRAWSSAWPDAAVKDGIAELDRLAGRL